MNLLHIVDPKLVVWPIIYFLFAACLLDGYFIYSFLKTKSFKIAAGIGLLSNLFSLFICFFAWPYIFPTGFDFADLSIFSYGLLWLTTVTAEALIIQMFIKKQLKPVMVTSAAMNLVSFTILYLFFVAIN
jgi:hypothetical protein